MDMITFLNKTTESISLPSIITVGIHNNVLAVNPTKSFGSGNEPSKEWCDEHLSGYFEGTIRIEEEKVNLDG